MRWSASSCCVTTSSGTSTSRFGTSSVVQSAGSGFACTANSAVKLQLSASLVGSSYWYSGCSAGRARVRAAALQNQRADVRLDRLGVDALLADLRDEHRHRHLAGPEAGDADALGEIVRRVLDRVVDVVGRDLDRQARAVSVELLELRLHGRAIESECARVGRCPLGRGSVRAWSSTTAIRDAPHAQGVRVGSRSRARSSRSCSSSRAGRRTTSSPSRGASACSARRRSSASSRRESRTSASKLEPRADAVVASAKLTGDDHQNHEDVLATAVRRLHRPPRRARERPRLVLAHAEAPRDARRPRRRRPRRRRASSSP